MSSCIKFIDNNKESGDWCVIILDGDVIWEGHSYPRGESFVNFFTYYQGIADHTEHIQLTDDEIENWREVIYGEA